MAENIDEEFLDNSPNTKSDKPSEEIIPIKDTDTINPNQVTENMEVHKHPHHVTHKKKWGEYFLEFLMLFLAVFLGFIAENIREHQVEKEKGKQYIQSFVEDLKYDTTSLSAMIKDYKAKSDKLTMISSCYDSLFAKQSCYSCLSELFANSQAFRQLDVSDRTLQQLKNAGGLRLLNKVDADSVTAYDNLIKGYKIDETTVFQETQTSLRSIMNKLFNYSVLRKLTDSSYVTIGNPLVTTDKILLNEYFNTLARYRNYCNGYILAQEQMNTKAAGLISYFTNKYDLK